MFSCIVHCGSLGFFRRDCHNLLLSFPSQPLSHPQPSILLSVSISRLCTSNPQIHHLAFPPFLNTVRLNHTPVPTSHRPCIPLSFPTCISFTAYTSSLPLFLCNLWTRNLPILTFFLIFGLWISCLTPFDLFAYLDCFLWF